MLVCDNCLLLFCGEELMVQSLGFHGVAGSTEHNNVNSQRPLVIREQHEITAFILGQAIVVECKIMITATEGATAVEGGEDGLLKYLTTVIIYGVSAAVVLYLNIEA